MSLVSRYSSAPARDQAAAVAAGRPAVVESAVPAVVAEREARAAVEPELERPILAPRGVGMPYNAVTGAAYAGRNIDRLLTAELLGAYGAGGWAGFKQWLSVGRVVRKGEHGTACVTVIGKRESSTEEGSAEARKGKGGGVRGFRVFHFDQTCELVAEEEGK